MLFSQSGLHLGVDGRIAHPGQVAVALLGHGCLADCSRRIEQLATVCGSPQALLLQCFGQSAHALAGPPQRRFRIPPCRWFYQRLEIRAQRRVLDSCRLASRPRPPNPPRWFFLLQFLQTPSDRARRQAGCQRHRRRPRSSRNGATVENRARMGSTSITTTTYDMIR